MGNFVCVVRFTFFRINLLVFILISLSMTFICEKVPSRVYYYKKWLFRERGWENGGRIYEYYFGVKKWKSKLPDISDFMKWRFNKKHLAEASSDYLSVFLTESCKSEFTHWMIIASTLFFNFWNDIATSAFMVIIACLLNMPYIIIQRYNRPRLIKLLRRNNINEYVFSAAKV
jgi:glycosyl-4,4'-diaponeurosporenoate acyltransferase